MSPNLYDALKNTQRMGAQLVLHVRRAKLSKATIAADLHITQREADTYIWLATQFDSPLLNEAAEIGLSVQQLQAIAKRVNKVAGGVDKQRLRKEFIQAAQGRTLDALIGFMRQRIRQLNDGRCATAKPTVGISKQPDDAGMGHLHAKLPYNQVKEIDTLLNRDVAVLRKRNPKLGYSEAKAKALVARLTTGHGPSQAEFAPCFFYPVAADAQYFADGKVATSDGATYKLADLVNKELADYGYAIVSALDADGVPQIATSYLLKRQENPRDFSPWQKFLATAEHLTCAHSECPYMAVTCQGHHIKAYKHGGQTVQANCAPLCGPHNAQNDDDPARRPKNGRIVKDPATGRVGYQWRPGEQIRYNWNHIRQKGLREWAIAYYGLE